MKAAVWYGRQDVRIKNVPEPAVRPGTVKVRVKWCGICGSDVHEFLDGPLSIPADKPNPLTGQKAPLILGHEFSGEIAEVGAGVTGFKVGDRVTVETLLGCLACPACLAGKYLECEKFAILGIMGDGAFAEYVLVSQEFVHKLPDGLDYDKAALTEPLAVGFHALSVGNFRPGMTAVVLGAGPIGLGVIQVLRASGARKIIAVVRKSLRQQIALSAGADIVLDPEETDVPAEIKKLTGGAGADMAFETFGADIGVELGMQSVRNKGTVVIISLWTRPASVDLMALVQREIKIVGSALSTYNDFETVLAMLRDGRITAEGFITDRISLDDIVSKGFCTLSGPEKKKHIKILVSPEAPPSSR